MKRISNVLNDHPVSAQRTQSFAADEAFLISLTLNMPFTGRSHAGPLSDYVDIHF